MDGNQAEYDIAIIGTGPAGISAAINARIRNKSCLLYTSNYYGKESNSKKSHSTERGKCQDCFENISLDSEIIAEVN